jgi:phage tail-like protein
MLYIWIILVILLISILIYFFIIKPFFMQQLLNSFHFIVEWGGARINFTEVSGLDIEVEVISYREGGNATDGFQKLPGLKKFSDLTLKRGIVKNDNDFFNWIHSANLGNIERRDVTISLLNAQLQPVAIWKAKNAFPAKYFGPVLNAGESNIAIETLVLTHEGITLEQLS